MLLFLGSYNNNNLQYKFLGFLKQIRSSINSVSSWPSHEDVTGSAIALTKLLHTYDLDPDDVAKGRLLHTQTTPLDADELFVLGEEVHHHHNAHDARMWLNISITRLEEMRDQERLLKDAHHRLREVEEKVSEHLNNARYFLRKMFYDLEGVSSLLLICIFRAEIIPLKRQTVSHVQWIERPPGEWTLGGLIPC